MFNERIKHLQKELVKLKIGTAILFSDDINTKYFCGFDASCLVIPAKGNAFIVTGVFDFERSKSLSPFKVLLLQDKSKLSDFLNKVIKSKVVGSNYSSLRVSYLSRLKKGLKGKKLKDISETCINLRSVKSKEEIKKIKKSCTIASKILEKCISNFGKFNSEKDVYNFLKLETAKVGCDVSFDPVVASGVNSCKPHWEASNNKLKWFVVIDFGVKYEGYCSDITRTVFAGSPSKNDVETYNKVLNIQEKCINMLKPGVKCVDVFDFADKELGKVFTHGLGHGVGLEIHEKPNLTLKSDDVLKEGMIVTVEPGVYFKNTGVRIEDDVLITKNGCEVLTKPRKVNLFCTPKI